MASDFQRARSDDAKEVRVRAILASATALAAERMVREVTLTDIALATGLHKSGLLRYFESREHILLEVTAQQWHLWSVEVREAMAEARTPSQIAHAFTSTLLAHPLFCDLLAQTPLNLERNVSIEVVRAYKLRSKHEVDLISADLTASIGLTAEQGLDVLATATGLVGAFWQTASPRAEVAQIFNDDPRLAHAVLPIAPRLERVMDAVLTSWAVPTT